VSQYPWDNPDMRDQLREVLNGLVLGEPLTMREPIVIKNPSFVGLMNRLYNGEAENVRESEL